MLLSHQPERANPLMRLQQATMFQKLCELTDGDAGRMSRCLFGFREQCSNGTLQSHKPVVGHHQLQLLLGGCPHHQNTKYLRTLTLVDASNLQARNVLPENYYNIDCFVIYPHTCALNIYH